MCKDDKNKKGDDDLSKVVDDVKIDIKKSITKSLDDIEKIENGLLPKQSYKHMIDRVTKKLNEEKQ